MFAPNSNGDTLAPLRKLIEGEATNHISARRIAGFAYEKHEKEMILRKTTIAYGLAELLMHARAHHKTVCEKFQFSIDNFAVRFSDEVGAVAAGRHFQPTWKDIKGVDMISPQLSLDIVEPSFLCDGFSDVGDDVDQEDQMGRYLIVESPTLPEDADGTVAAVSQGDEDACCHSLGVILYELFSHFSPLPDGGHHYGGKTKSLKNDGISQEPAHKKTRLLGSKAVVAGIPSSAQAAGEGQEKPHSTFKKRPHIPLVELGFPSTICLLVQNLLECREDNRPDGEDNRPDDAYDSLDAAIKDLHLLLLDPSRFLFDGETTSENGSTQLSFRKHQLYGRENEVSLITDAFCRVSTGKSEALFVGGFSGSGKSRLVNSLTARVDISEGYVLTHKFDQMSKKRPLWEVISLFNQLCILIREKRTQQDLFVIANNLKEVFRTDFSVLARLLPSIYALSSQPKSTAIEKESGDKMSFRSVCFILQRFMRVVSSKSHPVMLFLDDLQWCNHSALTLIKGILSDGDAIGSSCFFFVGSYRSNEVQEDHEIFHLIDNLSLSGVPTTKLSLEGLTPEDLNTMISDALCIFPRICGPLSDIVFQKTKGNPFFVLEFLRSLVEGGLLEYCVRKRRWVWDEERISSMDISGNVLCLLSSKMIGLSENIQLALKVAACFGIKIKESIVGYLSTNSEYSNIQSGLEHAVKEGFMIKVGTSDFKFVHDKVREAAYSLIPDSEKNHYHYSLGMSLYSMTKGSNVDDIIFSIADQINHGMDDSSEQSPELQLDFAELNEMAGVKAVGCSDYATARSYLNATLSLLPTDHWKNHYDLSLRSYFLLAKSAYSCGDIDEACVFLQTIFKQAHCLSDKLDAYLLFTAIIHARGAMEQAYMTTQRVIMQLGESIPDEFGKEETMEMVKTTSKMLRGLSEESLLGMKEMESKEQFLMKFYSNMNMMSYHAQPNMVPFFTCRMIQLSMKHGICKYSLIGFVAYAAMGCAHNVLSDIQEACRIGKLAMSVLKRFDSSIDQVPRLYLIYYCVVAIYSEQVQSCADNLRRGFECGIASGDTSTGFTSAIHHIRTSLIAGTNLPTLLKRTEYYLELMEMHGNTSAQIPLLLYRETISLLMGKGCINSSEVEDNALTSQAETLYYLQAMRAYWIGHSERSHHLIEKLLQGMKILSGGRMHRIFVMLYYGLNALKITRRRSRQKLKAVPHNALEVLKTAAGYSQWNFRNKVYLLEAEIFSHEGRNEEAKVSYASAITFARSSRFIHEQGLACELAGFHCKKIGDDKSAWDFFNQAKQCYVNWGSQMKVDSITRQMGENQISLA